MLIVGCATSFSYITCYFLQLLLRKSLKQIRDVEQEWKKIICSSDVRSYLNRRNTDCNKDDAY